MLTPHQVCNAMSVLTEKIRSGRPAKPILRENLVKYDNYTRLFDRGHVRSVGWDGTNNTSLQPGGGPITLIGTGPKYPEQFTPVKKRHVMALYGTAFAAMNAAMLDDLRQYYAESQEYLKEMKLYDNDPSPQKRLPMRPRVPYKLDMRTTAYESSMPTLDLCLYKELSPRYDDWIEDITKGKNPLNNINAAIRNAEKAFENAWNAANNKYEYIALEKPFSVSNIPEKKPTLSEEVWAQSSNATSPPLSLEDRVRAMYKDPLTQSLAAFFYNKLVRMEHLKECISHDEKITTGWRILLLNGKRVVKSPASFRSAPYQMAYRKAQRAFKKKYLEETKQLQDEQDEWEREWETYNRAKASQPLLRLNPPPKRNFKKEWQQKNLALTEEMLRTKIQPLTFVEMLQTYNINGEEKREQLYRLWLNGKTFTEILQQNNLRPHAQNILEYTMHQYEYHFSEADAQNFKALETQALQLKNTRNSYAKVVAILSSKFRKNNGPGNRSPQLIPSSMSPSALDGIRSKVAGRLSVEEITQIVRALGFKNEEILKRTAEEELIIREGIENEIDNMDGEISKISNLVSKATLENLEKLKEAFEDSSTEKEIEKNKSAFWKELHNAVAKAEKELEQQRKEEQEITFNPTSSLGNDPAEYSGDEEYKDEDSGDKESKTITSIILKLYNYNKNYEALVSYTGQIANKKIAYYVATQVEKNKIIPFDMKGNANISLIDVAMALIGVGETNKENVKNILNENKKKLMKGYITQYMKYRNEILNQNDSNLKDMLSQMTEILSANPEEENRVYDEELALANENSNEQLMLESKSGEESKEDVRKKANTEAEEFDEALRTYFTKIVPGNEKIKPISTKITSIDIEDKIKRCLTFYRKCKRSSETFVFAYPVRMALRKLFVRYMRNSDEWIEENYKDKVKPYVDEKIKELKKKSEESTGNGEYVYLRLLRLTKINILVKYGVIDKTKNYEGMTLQGMQDVLIAYESKLLNTRIQHFNNFADPDLALMQQDQAYASREV